MWVNYAAHHTGFVVGFDPTDSFFTDEGGTLNKVRYQVEPPDMASDGDPPLDLCFIKSKDWEYEKKWRCVRSIPIGETIDVALPHTAIREIIMGWKITSSARIELLDDIEALRSDHTIAVSDSVPNRKTWTFSHKPTKFHLCTQCGGRGTTKDKA
jgi:hypothetical protein